MITVSCFKSEEFGHSDGSTTVEVVLTYQSGHQIKSRKDVFQFDYEDIKMLIQRRVCANKWLLLN
jgi:hypothetical protein